MENENHLDANVMCPGAAVSVDERLQGEEEDLWTEMMMKMKMWEDVQH